MIYFKVKDKDSMIFHTWDFIQKYISIDSKLENLDGSVEIESDNIYGITQALLQDIEEDEEEMPSVKITILKSKFTEKERDIIPDLQSEMLDDLGWDSPWVVGIEIDRDGCTDWFVIHTDISYDSNGVFCYYCSYV